MLYQLSYSRMSTVGFLLALPLQVFGDRLREE